MVGSPSMQNLFRGAVMAGLVLAAGCAKEDPIDAFLKFVDALADRDAVTAWQGLAKVNRDRLTADAAKLSELSGQAVTRKPRDLLVATALWAKRGKRPVTLAKVEADRAILRVGLDPSGEDEVTLVREDGEWRVLLPLPPS
jgi:hypothetical protein